MAADGDGKKADMKTVVVMMVALGLAISLQLLYQNGRHATTRIRDLRAEFPTEIPGWTIADLPVGATELLKKTTLETLRYDEVFYRSYTRSTKQFSVFIAYWTHGRQPPQMVAQHTPDRCWTMNGSVCDEARHGVVYLAGRMPLAPAQWRRFRNPDGTTVYVLFWHRIGDRFFDYGDSTSEMLNPLTFWTEAARFMMRSNSDQYFFRVTANVPPEKLLTEPAFQQILRGMAKLGLARGAAEEFSP